MRFKLLVFLLAAAFLAGTFLTAFWYYQNVDQPQKLAEAQLKQKDRQAALGAAPDPGQNVFVKAVEALRQNQPQEAREHLLRLTKIYQDSPRCRDARRILGEMNMDRLFSRTPMPGKHDYAVKPGDSLLRIEKGSLTTIPFLNRLNNLSGTVLQPGDRLVYQPLEFEIEVSLPQKTLTVRQKAPSGKTFEFFKDYPVTSVNLPPGIPKTLQTQIQEKAAFIGEKKIPSTDLHYQSARKWLQCSTRAGRLGLLFRPQSERKSSPATSAAGSDDLTYGIFLEEGDIEELNTIIRPGTPVAVHQ
ncbi:MAG: LysM peptidoglycan-binding domain-containing protein [Verrucomicrobiales bacterium]